MGETVALSDFEIRDMLASEGLVIEPFEDTNLGPAGYDLRLAAAVVLKSGQHELVATLERVELGRSVLGILHIRSSLAREGIVASLALVDPGFRGQLTISLFNSGRRDVHLQAGERFVQLTLVNLGRAADKKYEGRYQDSSGVVASRR